MKKLLIPLLLFLVGAQCALAQTAKGSITSIECVSIGVDKQSTVGIQITGSWTGTIQPKISIQGQTAANIQVTPSTSSTAQSTITANGVYRAVVAGGSTFMVCGNTVATAPANVFLNASTASAGLSGGGGPGVTSVTATAPTASSGGATPDISCPTCVTSAAALTANQIVVGGGNQASAALGSAGTTTTVLHGNAAGNPSFGAVVNNDITNGTIDLTTKVTGVLPLANGGRTLLNTQFASNTLTGDSTDQVIFTFTIPGGTIAAGEGIRILARFTQTGTTSTTYKVNFGGTTMLSTATTAAGSINHIIEIFNEPGVTNAQVLMGKMMNLNAVVSGTYTDAAVDTTANVVVTITFNVANTVTITGSRAWAVEIIH